MKLDPYLAHKTNIRTETIKFPEENTGENSLTLFLEMIFFFFELIQKAQARKAKISKQDYIKLKSFCTAKERLIKGKNNL